VTPTNPRRVSCFGCGMLSSSISFFDAKCRLSASRQNRRTHPALIKLRLPLLPLDRRAL
jgi:hypothetical protein